MNLNLRQAIVRRVHSKSGQELHEVIQDSLNGDDRTLPGLGVLFEIIWQHSDEAAQQQMVQTLEQSLQSMAP